MKGLLLALRAEQRASGRGRSPPPPFLETKNQLRPLPEMPRIFSFVALKYRNLLPGLAPEGT